MSILPILVATVLTFILGFLWFGPVFGKKWAAACGKPMESCNGKPPVGNMVAELLNCLVKAVVFRWVLFSIPHTAFIFAFILAIALPLGFALPGYVSNIIWAGRPKAAVLYEAGFSVASVLLIALVYSFI